MTVITLIAWLKRAWDVIKKILAFLWEYKTIIVIALLLLIISTLRNDVKDVIQEKEKVVQEFHNYKVEQEVELLEERIKTKDLEVDLLNKQNKLEVEYNAKLQEMQSDVITLRNTANSLSTTLNTAKQRASTSDCDTVRTYSKTVTELLEDVSARRDYYAERAELHANAEVKAVERHNSLVDALEEYNKDK